MTVARSGTERFAKHIMTAKRRLIVSGPPLIAVLSVLIAN